MLPQAARYSAASTRARAALAGLIPPDRWADLVDAPDLSTLAALLRPTWYGPLLPNTTPIDALQLERALTQQLVSAMRRPLALLQGRPRELLEWYWRRFELDNLKTILRGVHHGFPPGRMQAALIPLGDASRLPWLELTDMPSIAALSERLEGHWYGRTLNLALDQYRRQQSIFPLEVALDLAYYDRLLEQIAHLRGADHADALAFLGDWIDGRNLLWAYRYRLYARLSPEEILNYTLQHKLRVDAEVVRTIALGAPLGNIVRSIWRGRLIDADALAELPEDEALPRLELLLERRLFEQAQHARVTAVLRLATILAYMFLLEYEVRDLITIAEGISFGWPGERIRPYLIGKRGL